jgi:tetratricopeptide (TPR) repeat protein
MRKTETLRAGILTLGAFAIGFVLAASPAAAGPKRPAGSSQKNAAASSRPKSDVMAGLDAYRRGDYKTASARFESALNNGTAQGPAVLLYAAHSMYAAGDQARAMQCYSRLLVMYPNSQEAKSADACMKRIHLPASVISSMTASGRPASNSAVPSSPGDGGAAPDGGKGKDMPPTTEGSDVRRWLPDAFPLRVCVTSGLELPAQFRARGGLKRNEYRELCNMFKQPNFLNTLRANEHYGPEDRTAVSDGLQMWATQSVIKFTQTASSADADILVFFCDSLPGAVGMCNYPREANQPAIIEIVLGSKEKYKQGDWYKSRKAIAAHEIGHAFGLGHLNSKEDIMYKTEDYPIDAWGDYICRQLSPADRAQIHRIYTNPPGYWMSSVRNAKK